MNSKIYSYLSIYLSLFFSNNNPNEILNSEEQYFLTYNKVNKKRLNYYYVRKISNEIISGQSSF